MHARIAFIASTLVATQPGFAAVEEFTDFVEWRTAVGNDVTTITFAELGSSVLLSDQYSEQGVLFPETNDGTLNLGSYLNDTWGVSGTDATITVDFATDVNWVGVHFPGLLRIQLYADGELLSQGPNHSGFGFVGVTSDVPFDRVVFFDQNASVNIDDLHFQMIPAPGAAFLLATLALTPRRRRTIALPQGDPSPS